MGFPNTLIFSIVVENNERRVLEMVNWDPLLTVSALEKEFVVDEDSAKRKFRFSVKYEKDLDLELDDSRKLNLLNTLPLVFLYSNVAEVATSILLGQNRDVLGFVLEGCV
ncbi:hypothetical protein GLYMA_15G165400v4 [Glycine max]|uniref:PORR domain-containing protein n=2 Tax=Glycine subgen. Soja TaxID=1462606 RepID=K7MBT8_SOYBN|nr:hypothetical protein JHK87_042462 [Glycine soja]KAH1147490.1 hypothetical protein GYH30_042584 [Glycine max]KHN15334.1 hypothetical protein glysoja_026629 [Glycine soja]KRH12307.1 hypothetical protein GLYMA_15G165400v4 [Glycine max]